MIHSVNHFQRDTRLIPLQLISPDSIQFDPERFVKYRLQYKLQLQELQITITGITIK